VLPLKVYDIQVAPVKANSIKRDVLESLLSQCIRPLALIISGSPIANATSLLRVASCCDAVIAADYGAAVAIDAGIALDYLVGDMDSLPKEIYNKLAHEHVNIIAYNVEKDETDLELALRCAHEQGFKSTVVLNWRGGRIDHELACLGAAAKMANSFAPSGLLLLSDSEIIIVVAQGREVNVGKYLAAGQIFSTLPIMASTVISECGLRWNLQGAKLEVLDPRGISNVVEDKSAAIQVESGAIAIIINNH
jgi:thiamine pyrophosphokinase